MSSQSQNPSAANQSAPPRRKLPWPLEWLARPLARLSTSRFNLRAALVSDCLIGLLLVAAGLRFGPVHWLPGIITVAGGMLAFTFIEYAAHRWLFHGHTGPFEAGHASHHVDPLGYDALPFFMPPLFLCTLGALFALAMPVGYALLLAGVIALGYAAYGLSHAIIHVHRFKSPLLRRWAGFHNIHHFHPETNFGVTTGLWDFILRTHYQRQARRPR